MFKQFFENAKPIMSLAEKANLDISGYNLSEIVSGMEAEKEHDGGKGKDLDIIDSDVDILKVVIAHLREDKNYYSKLKKAGL